MDVEDRVGDNGSRDTVQQIIAAPARPERPVRRYALVSQANSLDPRTSGVCRRRVSSAAFRAVDIEVCHDRGFLLSRCALGLPEIERTSILAAATTLDQPTYRLRGSTPGHLASYVALP